MPIEMSCPFCQKAYKLKDELAGKKVTCANVACRRAFLVPGTAQSAALPSTAGAKAAKPSGSTAPKAPPPPPSDREAEALAALSDDPTAAPQEIEMKCVSCDHVWTVGLDMQGKNVLCPECRHRQKVPVMKDSRRDWRVKEGAPSLAKQEKLEGVQASADTTFVSGEALRKTGVIQEEFEPRPLRFWFLVIGGPIVAAVLLVVVIVNWRTSSKETKLEQFVADAIKELEEPKDLPPAEVPLFKAALRLAAGEFALNRNDADGLKDALAHFAKARVELGNATASTARDFLLIELAVAELALGGNEDQVTAQTRIRWTPAPAGTSRAKLNEKSYDVQGEVLAVLKLLRRDDRPASAEARILGIRKLAQALTARGQPELTDTLITGTTFLDTELNEARCYAAVEIWRLTGQSEKAFELVTNLKPQIQGLGPAPFQAICSSLEPPVTGVTLYKLPSAGDLQDGPRMTFTLANMLQKKPDEALTVAKRNGPVEGRARALALLAEWSSDPLPILEAGRDIPTAASKGQTISEVLLTRLAIQAGRAGNAELFDLYSKAIKDDKARAWAKGEAVRQKMSRPETKTVEDTELELPADSKDYRLGQAWGRLAMARQNAKITGQSGREVLNNLERWGVGTFRPFGLLGLALGLQDRDRSGAKP